MSKPRPKFEIGDRVTTQWGDNDDDYIYPLPDEGGIILDVEVKTWGERYHVEYIIGEIDRKDSLCVLQYYRVAEEHVVAHADTLNEEVLDV